MPERRYEPHHPRALEIAQQSINARMMVGQNSEAKKLRAEILGRKLDLQLVKLYMPHEDEVMQARAVRTIKFLQREIDSMTEDLQFASERRAA